MRSLSRESGQLDADEGVEGDNAVLAGIFGFADVRVCEGLLWPNLLVGKHDVNRLARLGIRAIEKDVQTGGVAIDKTSRFQSGFRGRQILPADQYVDVLGIPHSGFINARNPERNGIVTSYGIRNVPSAQSGGRPEKTLAHFLHSVDHPFEREWPDGHDHSHIVIPPPAGGDSPFSCFPFRNREPRIFNPE